MPHKFITVLAIVLLTLMTGCLGGGHQASWQQQGVSPHDTNSDISECKYQATLNQIPKNEQQELIANCMQGKGFRYQ